MNNSDSFQNKHPDNKRINRGEVICDLLDEEMATYPPDEEWLPGYYPSDSAVIDANSEKFLFYHSHLNSELGHLFDRVDADLFRINFFYRLMEPHDARFVADTKEKTIDFLLKLPPLARKKYLLTIDCCIKDGNNQYYRLLNHTQPISTSDDGSRWIVRSWFFLIASHTGYTPPLRILRHYPDYKQKLFYKKDPSAICVGPQFLNIMRLQSRGMKREEIAEQLLRKYCTVNNNMTNGRNKLNLANMEQVEMYLIFLGLLP